MGFTVAIDDFGAGHAGLSLLADFEPDVVKLDMGLARDIHLKPRSRILVKAIQTVCDDLGVRVVAEGVETIEEYEALRDSGITLFQGFLFARPGLGVLPRPTFPSRPAEPMPDLSPPDALPSGRPASAAPGGAT